MKNLIALKIERSRRELESRTTFLNVFALER
jgi:hypothetical protein